MRATVALLIAALVVGSAAAVFAIHTISPRTGIGDLLSMLALGEPEAGSLGASIKANERVNILLMAHGGAGNDNQNFTDSMLVVSIRPHPRKVVVIALPRYLWVAIPAPVQGELQGKIYTAFAIGAARDNVFLSPRWRTPTGAGDLAAATVTRTIGQPVSYWVAIDSGAFAAVVDMLGGVQVTVTQALDDPNFPVEGSDRTMHIHFDAGRQVLDGERALQYSRSRISTSEADRSLRQEIILSGLLRSVRSAHIGLGVVPAIGPLESGLRTNLRPLEMREFAQLVGGISEGDVKRITLDGSELLARQALGDGEIIVPRDGTYSALQRYLALQLP